MTLWIITSSPDNLYLFKFLNTYNFSYTIWYDQEGWHWGDKTPDFVQKRIEMGLDCLIGQWAQQCILPPSRELVFLGIEKYKKYILPLFSWYIAEHVLPWARIGKVWLLGDRSDLEKQDTLKALCTSYTLSEKQKATWWFQHPFLYRSKQTPLRKHFLISLGRKDWMMHNVVKNDLRYFADAWVDVVIPLNYGYFAYDVTIAKFFRAKKCRWQKLEKLAAVFADLTKAYEQTTYSVTLSHTGTLAHLQAEKKRMRLLQKGKQIEVTIEKL